MLQSWIRLLVCCTVPIGLVVGQAEATKYAGETFSVGVGARALGMGGAAVAVAGDVTSGYWNPASLVDVERTEIGLMHSERFGGVVNYDYLGMARPLGRDAALGLTLIRQGVSNIPVTRLIDPERPPFYVEADTLVLNIEDLRVDNSAEYQLALTCGRQWSEALDLGASIKFIYKDVVGENGYGAGLDAGARWALSQEFSAGLKLQDLTLTPLVWSNGSVETILPSARLGFAWFRPLRNSTTLLVAADGVTLFEGRDFAAQLGSAFVSVDFAVGAEVWMAERIAMRAGLDIGELTAGASLRLGRIDLDYAFRRQADFDDTHRLGLRLELDL